HRASPQVIPVPKVHAGIDLKPAQLPRRRVQRVAQAIGQREIGLYPPTVLDIPLILVRAIFALDARAFRQGAEGAPVPADVVLCVHLKSGSPQVGYIKVRARAAAGATKWPA